MNKEIHGVPVLIYINKVDLATREHSDKALAVTRKIFEEDEILEITSKTGANLPNLLRKISERLMLAVYKQNAFLRCSQPASPTDGYWSVSATRRILECKHNKTDIGV